LTFQDVLKFAFVIMIDLMTSNYFLRTCNNINPGAQGQ